MEKVTSILGYLFKAIPGSNFKYTIPVLVVAVLLILAGIVFGYIYNKKKKDDFAFKRLFKKTGSRLVLMGILFLVLVGVRYENIPYFSMRIWLYLSALLLLYVIYKLGKNFFKDYPKERENMFSSLKAHAAKKEENRYLPNKNKR
ncbi:MAG: hypothetical protein WC269_02195 [Candidatus Gracilibacteria bacterium]|jgi:hypothetical protein